MIWKFSGNLPVYQQIIDTIESAVLSGEYTPGQKIPSVRDLAIEAKVNPNTMQHALQELEHSGLLISKGTSGRFVTEDAEVLKAMRSRRIQELTKEFWLKSSALGFLTQDVIDLLQGFDERKDGI